MKANPKPDQTFEELSDESAITSRMEELSEETSKLYQQLVDSTVIQSNLRSDYRWFQIQNVVVIEDSDKGSRSVTNDAENVMKDLEDQGIDLSQVQIVYRDSMQNWDEMYRKEDGSAGFRHITSQQSRETKS